MVSVWNRQGGGGRGSGCALSPQPKPRPPPPPSTTNNNNNNINGTYLRAERDVQTAHFGKPVSTARYGVQHVGLAHVHVPVDELVVDKPDRLIDLF